MESDIVLLVDGYKLMANKSVLCHHSPYFQAMFKDHFLEENKSEVELHSVSHTAMSLLLEWTKHETLSQEDLSTQEVMELLQYASMLQFTKVQELCTDMLCSQVDMTNCWSLLQFSDMIAEDKLLHVVKTFIFWNFAKTLDSTDICTVDQKIIEDILNNELINVGSEMIIFKAIVIWTGKETEKIKIFPKLLKECLYFDNLSEKDLNHILNHELLESDNETKNDIMTLMNYKYKRQCDEFNESDNRIKKLLKSGKSRCPPTFPCVIGHIANKQNIEEKKVDDEELDDWNQMGVRASRYQDTYRSKEKTVHMFIFDPKTCQVQPLGAVTSVQDGDVEASGFKVASTGIDLILSGGEFSLGQSNWSRNVTHWNSFRRKWNQVTIMDRVRRHHTVVIMNRMVYLLGGFGKHRIILDSVDCIDLDTGDTRECASLPVPMYRPAAVSFKDKIFVVGKKLVMVYHPHPHNYWTSFNQVGLPSDVEFDSALASGTHIYLTSAHSRELHRFDPHSPTHLELVGKFTKETNNTCIVNNVIYNFNSEEFDDERVVESFDTKTQEFKVLWKKEIPEWDFSPHYCLGCFPIVNYN